MNGLPIMERATVDELSESLSGEVSFKGRGLGYMRDGRILLEVCPVCSQWNQPTAVERGICGWCAFEPSVDQAEPIMAG